MADVLIHNADEDDLRVLDAMAESQGPFRNELLRHSIHDLVQNHALSQVTLADFARVADMRKDMLNSEFVRSMWQ